MNINKRFDLEPGLENKNSRLEKFLQRKQNLFAIVLVSAVVYNDKNSTNVNIGC